MKRTLRIVVGYGAGVLALLVLFAPVRAQVSDNVAIYGRNLATGVATFLTSRVLPAGGTSSGSAPIYFTSQASGTTTPEAGAMEYIGHTLQFTQFVKRRGVAMSEAIVTSTTTVANTTSESAALVTAQHGANYLEVGMSEKLILVGTISQRNNANAVLDFNIKYAGVTVQTLSTPASTVISGQPFELHVYTTVRSVGASGTLRVNANIAIGGTTPDPGTAATATIDTTTQQDTTITVRWREANAADTVSIDQGNVLCLYNNK